MCPGRNRLHPWEIQLLGVLLPEGLAMESVVTVIKRRPRMRGRGEGTGTAGEGRLWVCCLGGRADEVRTRSSGSCGAGGPLSAQGARRRGSAKPGGGTSGGRRGTGRGAGQNFQQLFGAAQGVKLWACWKLRLHHGCKCPDTSEKEEARVGFRPLSIGLWGALLSGQHCPGDPGRDQLSPAGAHEVEELSPVTPLCAVRGDPVGAQAAWGRTSLRSVKSNDANPLIRRAD